MRAIWRVVRASQTDTPASGGREADGARRALAPAAEEPADGGDPAADDEAGHGRADDDLLLVLHELAAPVGQDRDLVAQALDRCAELLAVGLDRGADLLGRARRHQRRFQRKVRLILPASSIAISGTGGVLSFKKRAARKPATPPRTNSRPATKKKPQKNVWLPTGSANPASHASPWRKNSSPMTTKIPAETPTTIPLR